MQIGNQNCRFFAFFGRIVKLLIFLSILSLTNIHSQEIAANPDETTSTIEQNKKIKKLSLNDCLALAIENNHKIKASKHAITISEYRKKQAESGYWPQLSARAAFSYTDQNPVFVIPSFQMSLPSFPIMGLPASFPDITVPEQNIKLMDKQNIHALIEMTFPLYTGGKVQALNRQAENGIEISRQDCRKSNLEIEYDVTRYFYSALLSKKIYDIGTEALERLDITLKLTESMYTNGSGKVTKLDYLKNKVMVDQVRTVVTEMKKNVKLSKDALAFTLGTDTDFELPDEEIPFTEQKIELVDSRDLGYTNNPDWAKLNAALKFYQAKLDEACSGYLPQVAIIGSFAKNFNSYKSGIVNKDNSQMWMISLGTEIPIFNGFRTQNEVNEARISLKKTEEEKLLLQDAIALQIKEALKKIEVSVENIGNTLQAKTTAGESRSLFERAFQQDMAEAKDLVEAQIMESLMEVQYQKALYDHVEAAAYLNFITGKIQHRDPKSMVSNENY